MKRADVVAAAKPELISEQVRAYDRPAFEAARHDHYASITVRNDVYRGHEIVVRTTYEIEVDGEPLGGHFGVDTSGQVHYHGLPNYSVGSAVDLVRQVIDAFPDDFPAGGHAMRSSA
jgi:hypothetical protein